jgi:hypothetical protein
VRLAWRALVVELVVTAAAAGGCAPNPSGGRSEGGSTGTEPDERAGQVRVQLTLPGGQEIRAVTYSLTNGTPLGTVTGTYVFPASAVSASFELPSVPAGTGYEILLTATSSDGTVTCEGSAPPVLPVSDASPGFVVMSGASTSLNLLLTCTDSADGGA